MVYRFKLVSDEVSNFSREIEVDSDNTFLQLRNAILDSVGFTKDELDSFFLCDDEWNKEEEITLEDMGDTSSDHDIWLMEETPVGELVEEEGQRLIFEFDYLTQRAFFMELKEIIPTRTLIDPVCTMKRGKGPAQTLDIKEVEKKSQATIKEAEDFDFESFTPDAYDMDELGEGYVIMDTE